MTLTGLRRGELASLKLKNAWLDVEPPRFSLDAGQTKNRSEAHLVLRADLAADVREWIARLTSEGRTMEDRIFEIPDRRVFLRLFDADLELAGIPKHDERGRVADVHCLRHSFATALARAGVATKDAQTVLRHSDVNLTLSVYSHSEFDELTTSLDALPKFDAVMSMEGDFQKLPPKLPPTGGKPPLSMACIGTEWEQSVFETSSGTREENGLNRNEKASQEGDSLRGFETSSTGHDPATSGSTVRRSNQLSYEPLHHFCLTRLGEASGIIAATK